MGRDLNLKTLLAAALILLVSGFALPAYGAPRIAFDRESVDYGPVPFDHPVTHSFRYTNVGDEPLEITGKFCHDELIMAKTLEGC